LFCDFLYRLAYSSQKRQIRVWRRALHFYDTKEEEGKEAQTATGAPGEEIDLAASDLGAFYEENDDDKPVQEVNQAPLPPVVHVHLEPMDFGGGDNSLLGKWSANSNQSNSQSQGMDLAGESCDPHNLREAAATNLYYVPYQFDADD
jgi:hypothetical protein